MLVAVWDHSAGTSTSSCSNMMAPLSLAMAAVRSSQTISSYGVLPASSFCVKYLGKLTPVRWLDGSAFLLTGCNSEILLLRSTESSPTSIFLQIVPPGLRLGHVCNDAPIGSGASRIISIYRAVRYEQTTIFARRTRRGPT